MSLLKRLWERLAGTVTNKEAEVVEGASVEELFKQLCADNGMRGITVRKSGLADEFVAWYQGAQNRQSILNSLESFKNSSNVAKKYIGDWE